MIIHDCQQGTAEWHHLRQGIVTGTTLKRALGTPKVQTTLMYELIAERMTEPQIRDINTESIRRGKETEAQARDALQEAVGVTFTEVGMIAGDIAGFAVSPDGIAFGGGCELKCPASKTHVQYLIENQVPADYEMQVLAPFLLSDEVEYWYFASYDERNYEKPLFWHLVERGQYDPDYIDECRAKLVAFLDRVREQHELLTF